MNIKITEKSFNFYIKFKKDLEERIEYICDILENIYSTDLDHPFREGIVEKIDIDEENNKVCVLFEEIDSWEESYEICFSLNYLFNDSWRSIEEEEQKEKLKIKREKELKFQEELIIKREIQERAEYERLKAKYENSIK